MATQAERLKTGIALEDNGKALPLVCVSQQAIFAEGAGGLPTMKIGLIYRTILPSGNNASPHRLTYSDNNYPGHAGWKEVIVVAGRSASILGTTASETDRSQELTNYPTDLLNSPPQQTVATLEFRALPANLGNQPESEPVLVRHSKPVEEKSTVPKRVR